VVDRLLSRAVHAVFGRTDGASTGSTSWSRRSRAGSSLEYRRASCRSADYEQARPADVPGLVGGRRTGSPRGASTAVTASAVEFLLEGLHLNRRLNKERDAGRGDRRYRA
jgi:hypothetical protein